MARKKLFKSERPGHGKIFFDKGVKYGDKVHEVEAIKWMIKRYGGEYRVLAESKEPGVRTPDAARNGSELIELKAPSTLGALENRLREAFDQLAYRNNHIAKASARVVVISAQEQLSYESRSEVIDVIKRRLSRCSTAGITAVIVRLHNATLEIYPDKK